MARKSRRNANELINDNCEQDRRTFKTAIYARLSIEDSGKRNSDTIENQVRLVRQFVEGRRDLRLCAVYQDNGYSGTSFDRPKFNEMMKDVRSGEIDCIAVKDLSRFGRSYIEAGDYLEKVFPFLGTRFISVNDGYDNHDYSCSLDCLAISLRCLISDVYAKDISKKIRAALRTKQQRGEFIGGFAAFGYLKSQADKHRLIVNAETAPIVKDIFRWKLEGLSNAAIARRLNGLGVLSPGRYLYRRGFVQSGRYASCVWRPETVKDILTNPVYTGCVSQGKRGRSQDEWINVPGMHEAIVDKADFEAVSAYVR
ncbi:MAG: recombinase family protein [Defluviitaleaceae bacterium]|nr:recombinase family protein [Defluviitaleaceae bacterium]